MIDLRATVILVTSAGCAVCTGALMLADGASGPASVLAAATAAGGAVALLINVIKDPN